MLTKSMFGLNVSVCKIKKGIRLSNSFFNQLNVFTDYFSA